MPKMKGDYFTNVPQGDLSETQSAALARLRAIEEKVKEQVQVLTQLRLQARYIIIGHELYRELVDNLRTLQKHDKDTMLEGWYGTPLLVDPDSKDRLGVYPHSYLTATKIAAQ